jgi:virginiamycin B lyase
MSTIVCLLILAVMLLFLVLNQWTWAQPAIPDEFVTYEKKSSFIKEFAAPFEELGLRGIIADQNGNVWFYHSTNLTSTLVKFEPESNKFTKFPIGGETVADNPIINLASSQLVFDSKRDAVWFTDARTNSIGKLDVASGQIALSQIPTDNAGPMGIVLSSDSSSIWFTEITGNKIASIDIESMRITEYSTGEDSGPALLTFDDSGILWVSLSFSNSVLRVDTQALSSNNPSSAMTELKLSGQDAFSPFGIALSDDKVYVSDHGSSRLVVADTGFVKYLSYWTSPSIAFPTTLPSQVVADQQGKIYFAQHGGNRISVIDRAGVMTEYEIPTGPLSTVLFLAAPDGDGKVWFTEWASNKIGYLDTTIQVPFTVNTEKTAVTLDRSGPQRINVSLNASATDVISPVSLSEVEIGLAGMTESGLKGVTYKAQPPRANLQEAASAQSEIQIRANENARPGDYVVMVRAFAPETDGLIISRLYPIELVLNVPEPTMSSSQETNSFQNQQQTSGTLVRDAIRIGAPVGAAGLIAFAIYRWKKAKRTGITR